MLKFSFFIVYKFYKKYNLAISEPIYYGNWSGRKKYLSYQDIIIALKNQNIFKINIKKSKKIRRKITFIFFNNDKC